MSKTKIEWCDIAWNPVTGCLYGCEYCCARQISAKLSADRSKNISQDAGSNGKMHVIDKPIQRSIGRENRDGCEINPYPFGFDPTFHRYRLNAPQKQKTPQTVFVCSMADLFGKWIPDEWIEQVFSSCAKAPQHTYLFLTQNPARYVQLAYKGKLPNKPNMWYGSTMTECNQASFGGFDEYNVFLNIEPLLEDVAQSFYPPPYTKWVIIGAETGNRQNRVEPQKAWIENIIGKYRETMPIFMKDSLIPIMGDDNMRREFPWR